jgi:hypothetical protein
VVSSRTAQGRVDAPCKVRGMSPLTASCSMGGSNMVWSSHAKHMASVQRELFGVYSTVGSRMYSTQRSSQSVGAAFFKCVPSVSGCLSKIRSPCCTAGRQEQGAAVAQCKGRTVQACSDQTYARSTFAVVIVRVRNRRVTRMDRETSCWRQNRATTQASIRAHAHHTATRASPSHNNNHQDATHHRSPGRMPACGPGRRSAATWCTCGRCPCRAPHSRAAGPPHAHTH